MVEKPGKVNLFVSRLIVYGGAAAGIGLVIAAASQDDAPGWWWLLGTPLAVILAPMAVYWIAIRLRYPTPEARAQHIADLERKRETVGLPVDRSRLAHRATRHKKAVLRDGVDATAVVTFLADGMRANEWEQLVYLELEVTREGKPPYVVQTGEYVTGASSGSLVPGAELVVKVDPNDPQRVAVDWEQSLRLR